MPSSASPPSPHHDASHLSLVPSPAVIGVDLGGTKCAVSVFHDGSVNEVARFPTRHFEPTFADIAAAIETHLRPGTPLFGISCGGPLDAAGGTILMPPNLPPSWHGVAINARLTEKFGGQAFLMNDANACALAEWRFGAGRGTQHMIFLTSGTGMGSGLILNGQLYEGATGDAGEIGHVRLRPDGPIGYGKAGSVEGFTSGGGIARLAEIMLENGDSAPPWVRPGVPLTTKHIAEAAQDGDDFARKVMRIAGERLGETLAILIDLFNPECVVLGGFYPRCRGLLDPHLKATLELEALATPRSVCRILPAELGETIGSYGAIAAALHGIEKSNRVPPGVAIGTPARSAGATPDHK